MPHVPYTTQAVIGWDNLFTRGTLTASSETTSGPAENAVDGLTWDYWETDGDTSGDTLEVELASATPADYLAIAAHDLGTIGASIELEGSANGSSWSSVAGPFTPTADKPYLWRFDAASWKHWRIVILGGPVSLGVLNVGELLVLPEGIFVSHRPESLNKKRKLSNNQSENGQFLGRSVIRSSADGVIKQDRVSQAFARTDWAEFTENATLRPFFWAWRYDTYPEEVMYGWTDEGAEVEQGPNGFMSVSVEVKGLVE